MQAPRVGRQNHRAGRAPAVDVAAAGVEQVELGNAPESMASAIGAVMPYTSDGTSLPMPSTSDGGYSLSPHHGSCASGSVSPQPAVRAGAAVRARAGRRRHRRERRARGHEAEDEAGNLHICKEGEAGNKNGSKGRQLRGESEKWGQNECSAHGRRLELPHVIREARRCQRVGRGRRRWQQSNAEGVGHSLT